MNAKKYIQLKDKYPSVIMLFEVGNRVLSFGEDAIKVANSCNAPFYFNHLQIPFFQKSFSFEKSQLDWVFHQMKCSNLRFAIVTEL